MGEIDQDPWGRIWWGRHDLLRRNCKAFGQCGIEGYDVERGIQPISGKIEIIRGFLEGEERDERRGADEGGGNWTYRLTRWEIWPELNLTAPEESTDSERAVLLSFQGSIKPIGDVAGNLLVGLTRRPLVTVHRPGNVRTLPIKSATTERGGG